jgi:hypothetical protein
VPTDFLCSLNIRSTLEWSLPLLAGVIGKAVIKYYEDARYFPLFDLRDRFVFPIEKQVYWIESFDDPDDPDLQVHQKLDISALVRERRLQVFEVSSAQEFKILTSKGKIMELCRMVHNSHYLFEQSKRLEDMIQDACDKLAILEDQRRAVVIHPFEEVERAYQDYVKELNDYIGCYIVFVELRHAFGYDLYKTPIEENRIKTLLCDLDQIFLTIRGQIDDRVFLRDIENIVFPYLVQFFEIVLLDGGPERLFREEDVDLLLEDIGLIEKLFSSQDTDDEGEGYGIDPQG